MCLPPVDPLDDLIDLADPDDLDIKSSQARIGDIRLEQELWSRFLESDDTAKPFDPCTCHDLPRGSCKSFKDYHVDRISRGLRSTGLTSNIDGLREPLKYQSFPLDTWRWALRGYFDAGDINEAFEYGWDPSYTAVPEPRDAQWNLQGASLFQNDVQSYIDQELAFGTLVGPFDDKDLPFKTFCSPINTVPKKNSSVRRTVVDCSQLGRGINAFLDAHVYRGTYWKLSLPTSQTIIELIRQTRNKYPGQRVLIFKLDFARWYRWFVLDPVSAVFFAIRWRGKVYLDTALSFGNRCAALAAQRVIWAVVWMFRTRVPPFPGSFNTGISCNCTHHCECGENRGAGYIDDFIGVCPQSLAYFQFNAAVELAKTLGLRLSQTPGHVVPPSTSCECLGILYDTDRNTMQLPQDKVNDLAAILLAWSSKQRATEHELAVLCGKLLFAANVIFAGRLFLNRCLATKRFAATLNQPTILTSDFFEDIKWWKIAIQKRNGVSFLVPVSDLHVSLDASSNGWKGSAPGLGGFNHETNEYFSCTVPPRFSQLSISDLELLAHVVALHLWSNEWDRASVEIHTDNQACFYLLRNGRSREDIRLQMSRWIAMCQVDNNFRLASTWISTKENNFADALSRLGEPGQQQKFDQLCAGLARTPNLRHVSPEHFDFNL